jgi:rare lipoprotein A (peptidoglycan hydrolase)
VPSNLSANLSWIAWLLTPLLLLSVPGCSASSKQLRYAGRVDHHHSRLASKSINAGSAGARNADLGPTQIVSSSWYGPGYTGRRTASGERFNPHSETAASKTLPLGSRARVTNPQNGKSTDVTITDRGPAVRGRDLDLSPAAAQKLGLTKKGVAPVAVSPLSER